MVEPEIRSVAVCSRVRVLCGMHGKRAWTPKALPYIDLLFGAVPKQISLRDSVDVFMTSHKLRESPVVFVIIPRATSI